MKKLKHSKLRNSYLLFETLCRFAMDEIAMQESSKSVRLITKYFKEGSPLGNELALYESLGNFTKQDSALESNAADELLEIAVSHRNKMDSDQLKKAKYRLVSEINDIYGQDVLSEAMNRKTDNYRVAASIYKLFEYGSVANPRELLQCKETIRKALSEEKRPESPLGKLDAATHTKTVDILYQKFENKYSGLNDSQKELLGKVATSSLNSDYLNSVINVVESKINGELHEGKVDSEFVTEALAEVRNIDVDDPTTEKLQLLVMLLGG